ncbi:hypothetical protein ACWDTD_15655 [Gordonia sp. NPDC003425]
MPATGPRPFVPRTRADVVEDLHTRLRLTRWTDAPSNNTIGSSIRTYRANAAIPVAQRTRYVETPSGFTIFGRDVVRPPRAWLERTANTVYVSEPAHGGHFAPFEVPDTYADELRTFFRPFRPPTPPEPRL